jgi:multidrug efflux pump subunit AcrB
LDRPLAQMCRMGLILYALKFRITFYVIAVLVMLAGIGAAVVMPKDVLPEVDIPVITLVWTYTGLDTPEMQARVTTYTEVAISNNVSDIQSMQSTTLQGITLQRIYFQPSVSIDLALAQITAATNSVRANLPPGIQPPIVMRFTASSVPVI